MMYQQLQKVCREKVCRIKIFRAISGKFEQNTLCVYTPKNCLLLHLWIKDLTFISHILTKIFQTTIKPLPCSQK